MQRALDILIHYTMQRALEWNSPAFFDLAIKNNASCEDVDLLMLWEYSGGGNFDDEFAASQERRR
jgi:hypothetical protein